MGCPDRIIFIGSSNSLFRGALQEPINRLNHHLEFNRAHRTRSGLHLNIMPAAFAAARAAPLRARDR